MQNQEKLMLDGTAGYSQKIMGEALKQLHGVKLVLIMQVNVKIQIVSDKRLKIRNYQRKQPYQQ